MGRSVILFPAYTLRGALLAMLSGFRLDTLTALEATVLDYCRRVLDFEYIHTCLGLTWCLSLSSACKCVNAIAMAVNGHSRYLGVIVASPKFSFWLKARSGLDGYHPGAYLPQALSTVSIACLCVYRFLQCRHRLDSYLLFQLGSKSM